MRRPLCAAGLVFISVVFLFVIKHLSGIEDYSDLEGRSRTLSGSVSGTEQRYYEDGSVTYIYLKLDKYQEPFKKGSIIRCALHGDSERPKIGSKISVKGRVQPWSRARNPGMFDQLLYQKTMGVDCALKDCDILSRSESFDHYREGLYQIRDYLGLMLDRIFGDEYSSILRAVTLGDRTALDSETKSMYQRNGIIHILAVSGLHISILGMGLFRLLKKLRIPVYISVPLAVFFMYSYGLMCGSSASSVRAVTMFGIRMGAILIKRTYDILTALTTAAMMILASSPLYITQAGFLFSFGAVLAVSALPPLTDEIFMIRGKNGVRRRVYSAFISGFDVALATIPIHTGFYYSFPVISLLINLVVIPLMAVVMAGAILAMITGAICLPVACLPALPVKLVLRLYALLCAAGDHLPVNLVITGCPPVYRIILYYLVVSVPFALKKSFSPAAFLLCVMTAASILTFRPGTSFRISFLDVGQGDCIYLTDGKGLDILTDGGSSTDSSPGDRIIEPFLKYNGVRELDYIFITHLDSDHYNGVTELVEMSSKGGVKIGKILLNSAVIKNGGKKYSEFSELCRENHVPIEEIRAGNVLCSGDFTVRCLYPGFVQGEPDEMNAMSTVTYVESGSFSCLLTGDIEGQGEEELTRIIKSNKSLHRTNVLKAAHHGSRNSTSAEFLKALSPELAIISAGKNNRYGHPHEETLERLEASGTHVISTIDSGAITVTPEDGKVTVSRYKQR